LNQEVGMLCQLIGNTAMMFVNASRWFSYSQETAMPILAIGMALIALSEQLARAKRAASSASHYW
jgi:hypothetical protein